MILSLLYLTSALSISAIAAYFSVLGLATIFPGSSTPIIIMGGVLEAGKLVAVIWLHRNWKTSPLLVKSYLTGAVLVLMGITSMGIFGFLSRAHIEHQTTTEKSLAMAENINRKIGREHVYVKRQEEYIKDLESRTSQSVSGIRVDIDQENARIADITTQMNTEIIFEQNRINEANQKIEGMDESLSQLELGPGGIFSSKKKKVDELKAKQSGPREKLQANINGYNKNIESFRAVATEAIQKIEDKKASFREKTDTKDSGIQPQIEDHNLNIASAHTRIDEFELEKFSYTDNARNLEAEVGPVKYVAEMITDVTGAEFSLSQAVRAVIVILVLVFDPLALLLVIAANISIIKHFPASKKAKKTMGLELKKLEDAKESLKNKDKEIAEKEAELAIAEDLASFAGEEIRKEISKLDKELRLKQKEETKLDDRVNLTSFELEEKLKEFDEESQEKSEEIELKKQELADILSRIEGSKKAELEQEDKAQARAKDIEDGKQKLFNDKAKLDESRAFVEVQSAKVRSEQEKYTAKIKNLEEILAHLTTEKQKASDEKGSLELQSSTLKGQIETQQKLIKSLSKTYSDASRSQDINEVFVQHEINETVKFLPDNQHLVSIKGERGRVHQFIVPKEHLNLSHEYYHKVAEALDKVLDEEDLSHEYLLEIAKYIRIHAPQYNCLT